MSPDATYALWRSLAQLYPAWSLPIDMVFSPSTWRALGVDLSASVVKDGKARRLAQLMAQAPTDAVPIMADMARINAERATDIFRTAAVGYISLPIALAALLSEAAPEFLRAAVVSNIGSVGYAVLILALTPIVYFCGMWRAKQLQWAIEYYKMGAIEPLAARKAAKA
jgi:hypothetical protein